MMQSIQLGLPQLPLLVSLGHVVYGKYQEDHTGDGYEHSSQVER